MGGVKDVSGLGWIILSATTDLGRNSESVSSVLGACWLLSFFLPKLVSEQEQEQELY